LPSLAKKLSFPALIKILGETYCTKRFTRKTDTNSTTVWVSVGQIYAGVIASTISNLKVGKEQGQFVPRSANMHQDMSIYGVGQSHIQPITTSRGTTNVEICYGEIFRICGGRLTSVLTMELPTHIPIVSSILPFIAIHIAVTCSAAFA